LRLPAPDDATSVQLPLGVTELENYIRETLTLGAASVTIFRYEDMTPEEILGKLIEYYVACGA